MASVGWEGNRARIQFRDAQGKQKTLRLGECSERNALLALAAMEHLLEAKRHDAAAHYDAVRWLDRIDDRLHARVVSLGLAKPRGKAVVTLEMLLDRFDAASTVKPATRAAYKQATDSLLDHLGASAPLLDLTMADADGWRKSIAEPTLDKHGEPTKRLARATVAKRVHIAKAIFRKAVKWGLIPSSPFADLRAGSQSNPDRAFYVAADTIRSILAACPDDQWRAIVALSRFAGLRCPSEIVALRWGDVNWERGRLMVKSPKTANYEGHAVRVVPISPELRPTLQDLFDRAEPGTEAVVPRLNDPRTNLRSQFERIIAKAGVTPWPRLFQNLRASCETDWAERFPAHVCAKWLGHSPLIAAKHYLQTRDAHFDMAAGVGDFREAATNPATQAHQSDPTAPQPKTQKLRNAAELVGVGVGCDPLKIEAMGAVGFEPTKA